MLPCRDALPYLTEDPLGLPISFYSYSCIHALLTDSTGLCVCNLLGLWLGCSRCGGQWGVYLNYCFGIGAC